MVKPLTSHLFTIAEIGLNHDGSLHKAQQLIDHAVAAGFSAVKFQLRSSQIFLNIQPSGARDLGSEIVDEYISRTFLDYDQYRQLYHYALSVGVDCFFSAWDIDSVHFVHNLSPRPTYFKVASADLTNFFLLDSILKEEYHLILSTGMSTQIDILSSCHYLSSRATQFSLLHCHSAYPSPLHHLNLNFIHELLKLDGPVSIGYSSHDKGYVASAIAVYLGADIVEKHIALECDSYGNDKSVSLIPEDMPAYVSACHDAFFMRNNQSRTSTRFVSPGEKANKISLSKSLIAKNDISAQTPFSFKDFDFYPSGEGLPLQTAYLAIGKPLLRLCRRSELLTSEHLLESALAKQSTRISSSSIGIPVRYRDVNSLLERFEVPYIEFHLTSGDILSDFKDIALHQVSAKTPIIGFHAPDIYSGSHIFDPFSKQPGHAHHSRQRLDEVFRHILHAHSIIAPNQRRVKLVCSFSSFSENNYSPERELDYPLLGKLLDELAEIYPSIDLLPQSLPACAWYLGGQRYVNLFSDPRQIESFCNIYKKNICFDLSHHIMACNFYSLDSFKAYLKLKPYISHVHLANASGIDDEGTSFENLTSSVRSILLDLLPFISNSQNVTAILETWEGHLHNGKGFMDDLSVIEAIRVKG